MNIRTRHRSLNTTFAGAVAVAFFIWPAACDKSTPGRDHFDIGEKVGVGALTYTVLESDWKSQLGESATARVPEANFLLIRISIKNGARDAKMVPALTLENTAGNSFTEVTNGAGVTNWLGLIRMLPPAQTEEGWVLFDVPTNSYNLRVSDTGEDGAERAAFVSIPLKLPQQSRRGEQQSVTAALRRRKMNSECEINRARFNCSDCRCNFMHRGAAGGRHNARRHDSPDHRRNRGPRHRASGA
jgi:hypothetical protein